jgi:hypothetical protein
MKDELGKDVMLRQPQQLRRALPTNELGPGCVTLPPSLQRLVRLRVKRNLFEHDKFQSLNAILEPYLPVPRIPGLSTCHASYATQHDGRPEKRFNKSRSMYDLQCLLQGHQR